MALYHKWDVKNGFAYVLQFFSLISDGLGGVSGNSNSVTHKNRISIFAHENGPKLPRKFLIPVDGAFLKVFQSEKTHKKSQSSKI